MKIFEMMNAALVIEDPSFCLYENERRSSQFKYIAAELVWYFTGRKDTDFITPYAKFWKQIENEDGSVNSAYGNLIFTETSFLATFIISDKHFLTRFTSFMSIAPKLPD